MSKYLIEASYTAEGAKGLIKQGGTARRAPNSCNAHEDLRAIFEPEGDGV